MAYRVSAGEERKITLNEADERASILQNVAMILSTPKGSVPLYRDFGISIEAIDRPIQAAKALLRSQVKEAVEKYEPRVEVVGVTFEQDPSDPSRLVPTVEIRIVGDPV